MLRVGTVGTSSIMRTIQEAIRLTDGMECRVVYSRTEERAKEFAAAQGAKYAFSSLDELAACPEVEAVYIASPNYAHCEQSIRMLSAGKHVLCEKPMASNAREVRRMQGCAREHGVVLLEAMKSVFEPSFDVLRKALPRLGTLRRATLSYCQYSSRYDKFKAGEILNAFNPALSNGALMDIGVYCVHPAALLFGMPKAVHASCVKLSNGVDGAGSALLEYDGMTVEVLYSKIADGALGSEFQGEAGSLVVDHISVPQELTLHLRKQPAEVLPTVHEVQSMRFEIAAFQRIAAGEEPCEEHTRASLIAAQIMDEIRLQCGLHFPADVD